MKPIVPAGLISAGIMLFGLSTSCLAVDVPESIDINLQKSNPALTTTNKDIKTVPGFNHAMHATEYLKNNSSHAGRVFDEQFTCKACHAGVERSEDIGSEAAKQKQVEEVNEAGGVKKYMHALCLDCHKSLKKAAMSTGQTSCSGCHNPK